MSRSLIVSLVLLSLIWGGSFFFNKLLLENYGPWMIAFLRSAFGLAAITVIMLALRKPILFRSIPWLSIAVLALINTAIPWALIPLSETRITSSMASVLNATTPMWTIIMGLLFFKSSVNRLQWAGMVVSFIGLMVLLA